MQAPSNAIFERSASITIDADPDEVYGLVSDITRMGEWSPEATGGAWVDDGAGAVGDWFEGTNQSGDQAWSRMCEVAVAEPGADFTFVVGGIENNYTWWSFEMTSEGSETMLTERWWIVNKSPALAEFTDEQIMGRVTKTESMLRATLAGIKATAER